MIATATRRSFKRLEEFLPLFVSRECMTTGVGVEGAGGEDFSDKEAQQCFKSSFSIGSITRGTIGNRQPALVLRDDPLSAMDIASSGNAAGSGVYRQAQNVAPAACVASDDPVTSSHIHGSRLMPLCCAIRAASLRSTRRGPLGRPS